MSDEGLNMESGMRDEAIANLPPPDMDAAPAGGEQLDAIEDIDFLLEEIESKIAPLALA